MEKVIPSIVLSFDRNRPLARHMIACYEELWPDNLFLFYIPYQLAYEKNTSQCIYVKSPIDIRATVLTLLSNFADDDWIYWCIDDKYPIKFDLEITKKIVDWISTENSLDVAGLLLCRTRKLLGSNNLSNKKLKIGKYDFLERKTYHQIWIHQFMRVKVLRSIFERFPSNIPRAKEMDTYKDSLIKCADHRLFVVEKNAAVFGESTVGGKITRNCIKSIKQKNIGISENLAKNIHDSVVIMGDESF
jgi:hypothetical protein